MGEREPRSETPIMGKRATLLDSEEALDATEASPSVFGVPTAEPLLRRSQEDA